MSSNTEALAEALAAKDDYDGLGLEEWRFHRGLRRGVPEGPDATLGDIHVVWRNLRGKYLQLAFLLRLLIGARVELGADVAEVDRAMAASAVERRACRARLEAIAAGGAAVRPTHGVEGKLLLARNEVDEVEGAAWDEVVAAAWLLIQAHPAAETEAGV